MGQSSLATRSAAIPFRSNWYDQWQIGNVFPDAPIVSDLYNLRVGANGYIRLSLPSAGAIVQCRLTLEASNTVATSLRIGIGRFAADGINIDSSVTEDEILKKHRIITGSETLLVYPAGQPIMIDSLDLLKALPREGDTGYSRDGFVLYIGVSASSVANWVLRSFKVDGSVQMGVL